MIGGRFELLQQRMREGGYTPLVLENERGRALVAPEMGGRVLAVSVEGMDCVWFNPDLAGSIHRGDWNVGGQRTWIAPERGGPDLYFAGGAWRCPHDMDPGHYRLVEPPTPESVKMASTFKHETPSDEIRIFLERNIFLAGPTGRGLNPAVEKAVPPSQHTTRPFRLRVDQAVSCAGKLRGLPVGAWSILQVPAPGCAVAYLDPERATPPYFRDDFFSPVPTEWVIQTKSPLLVRLTGTHQMKLGIPATQFSKGVEVQYFHRDPGTDLWLVVTQRFEQPRGGLYAESREGRPSAGGDIVQFYNHFTADEYTYAEIEAHAPAVFHSDEKSRLVVDFEFRWFRTDRSVEELVFENMSRTT